MPSFPPPPTEDESMEHVTVFLRLVFLAADADRPAGALEALLDDYLTSDVADLHCWYLAAVGPLVAYAGIHQLTPQGMSAADFWMSQRLATSEGPAERAAFQAIAAQLGGDGDAALDVVGAVLTAGGFQAVLEMVSALIWFCANMKRRGAYATLSRG
jgi:primosomal replication protein N